MPADEPLTAVPESGAMTIRSDGHRPPASPPLTPDEQRVVDAVVTGVGTDAVAERLGVPGDAVIALMASALAKLATGPGRDGPDGNGGPDDSGGPGGPGSSVAAPATVVSLVGRFRVSSGGRDRTPAPGQPSSVVQLVALYGGRVHVEEVIEHLWPAVDPSVGRARLRNVLLRLRRTSDGLIGRDDDHLVLDPAATTDLVEFDRAVARAFALEHTDPVACAAAAADTLDAVDGPLLPGARYEPWAEAACEAFRRRQLALLDLVARLLAGRGNLDRALAYLDRAIALEPYDECRYLLGAQWLRAAGRRGGGRRYLERLAAAMGSGVGSVLALEAQVA